MSMDDWPVARTDPAPPRTVRRKKRREPKPTPTDAVWIGSIRAWVPQGLCASLPLVGQVAGEDLVWRIAVAEWHAGRPALWRVRARVAWRKDGRRLDEKRRRILELAKEAGLPVQTEGFATGLTSGLRFGF